MREYPQTGIQHPGVYAESCHAQRGAGIMAMVECLNILKSAEGTICTGREMTRDDAEAWAAHMVNEDGTTGSHWPMEQTTALAESMGPVSYYTSDAADE